VSVEDLPSNTIIAFFLGLFSALIIEFVRYSLSKTRSREKALNPHLRILHAITTKILKEDSARNLQVKYQEFKRAEAQRETFKNTQSYTKFFDTQLLKEANAETLGDLTATLLSFSYSCNSAERLISNCVDFESEYQLMDTKGLLSLLQKRKEAAYMMLTKLHAYTQGVVSLTEKLRKEKQIKTEVKNTESLENIEKEYLSSLFSVHTCVEGLFVYGPEVEKELKKFL
jgi:predicted phage-related endonuclease